MGHGGLRWGEAWTLAELPPGDHHPTWAAGTQGEREEVRQLETWGFLSGHRRMVNGITDACDFLNYTYPISQTSGAGEGKEPAPTLCSTAGPHDRGFPSSDAQHRSAIPRAHKPRQSCPTSSAGRSPLLWCHGHCSWAFRCMFQSH